MWVLLVFALYGSTYGRNPAMLAQEFSSKELCLFAGEEFTRRNDGANEERGYDHIKYVCVPK
jgi:hypothetical protein